LKHITGRALGITAMKALLGRKIGMSQVFSKDGEVVPVTLIVAEPNIVTLRRTDEKDGYTAVQLALPRKTEKQDEKKSTSQKITPRVARKMYAYRSEFPGTLAEDTTVVGVDQFDVGDVVQIVGTSKGKGFAGVVKRHHFKGGPASHGHRHVLRRPGSIGARFPQHVFKGVRMAGRMGYDRVTVKNLSIVSVDKERNLLAIKGAVPGTRGSVVEIIASE
jgi:large subunit ribosomal protein L3